MLGRDGKGALRNHEAVELMVLLFKRSWSLAFWADLQVQCMLVQGLQAVQWRGAEWQSSSLDFQ